MKFPYLIGSQTKKMVQRIVSSGPETIQMWEHETLWRKGVPVNLQIFTEWSYEDYGNGFWDTESSSITEAAKTHFLNLALGAHLERQGHVSR